MESHLRMGQQGCITWRFSIQTERRWETRCSGLIDAGISLDGASDHGVSEALYLRDPDSNGVELYRDRPIEEWPRLSNGTFTMYTRPLDLRSLLADQAANNIKPSR